MIDENEKILSVEDLEVTFKSKISQIKIINNISFSLNGNGVLGIVGESGSGKTLTALSILKLLPKEISKITNGSIKFKGADLTKYSEHEMQKIRGKEISMIFQDPLTSLNPALTVKTQLLETIKLDKRIPKKKMLEYAIDLLKLVGIPSPEIRINDFPFKFSGGMQQRVMIAIAICREPSLLIADEPTTALDVSIQQQILNLLLDIKKKRNMALMIITHDMGVISKMCDRVLVMYGGKIMELADLDELFYKPMHPYTISLLKAIPKLSQKSKTTLLNIEGSPPELENMPSGCAFHPRCYRKKDICSVKEPDIRKNGKNHIYYCWNPEVGKR